MTNLTCMSCLAEVHSRGNTSKTEKIPKQSAGVNPRPLFGAVEEGKLGSLICGWTFDLERCQITLK